MNQLVFKLRGLRERVYPLDYRSGMESTSFSASCCAHSDGTGFDNVESLDEWVSATVIATSCSKAAFGEDGA